MSLQADVAIVGAGIVGLAHAYEAARRGYSVVVFERDLRAMGASVRNFGMLLPLGMAPGTVLGRAKRSRGIWLELASAAGFWHEAAGALVLAYREDELDVLQEFAARAPDLGYACRMLDREGVESRCPAVRSEGLFGGLWSEDEVLIDPREAMALLPAYLHATYGVAFRFGTAVTAVDAPFVVAGGETWRAARIVVATGADLGTLFPDVLGSSELAPCKLQMMRTVPQPDGWRLGPMLATGLSLRHYPSFAGCPSLPTLKRRIADEHPELERWGIHVLVSQNGRGELVIGDSHEYGLPPSPFDRAEIDDLILDFLQTFLNPPSLRIAERWHGVYVRHPERDVVVAAPDEAVRIVNGIGGGGMTISFGLAQEVFDGWQ